MKKKLLVVFLVLTVFACAVGIAACGDNPPDVVSHTHNYEWVDNGDGTHKQHCSVTGCDEPDINVGYHDYGASGVCACGKKSTEGLEFTLNDDEMSYSVTGIGSVTDADIVIPSEYNGKPVTGIGEFAFSAGEPDDEEDFQDGLTSVEIPNSVTSIGDYAFTFCLGLTRVEIPSSVTSIGNEAFALCVSLMRIEIPSSVTSLGECVFSECTIIYCEAENAQNDWDTEWDWDVNWEASHYYCRVIWDYKNNDKDINGYSYALIDGVNYSLKDGIAAVIIQPYISVSIVIPPSVTYKDINYTVTNIVEVAFRYCFKLTSMEVPDTLTSIDGAFEECSSLQYNEYGDGLYLGNKNNPYIVLIKCDNEDATSFAIHENTKCIYSAAFSHCSSLTSIEIPNGVTSIGDYAFYNCISLTSINFNGTKAQWNDVYKSVGWNEYAGDYTIHCTDGDIAKD